MIGELLRRSPGNATACAATWPCSSCRTSSSAPGASRPEPFWPKAIARGSAAASRVPVHGRGLLGPGMDAAAAGLRLRLRQAAVRPAARGASAGRCAGISTPAWTIRTAWRGFLENHDEPRAAATFAPGRHEAAAIVTFLTPGLRFFHQGQFEGRGSASRRTLVRAPNEPVNSALRQFYERLLECLRRGVLRQGDWRLLDCAPAWQGNATNDAFIAYGVARLRGQSPDRRRELRQSSEPVLRAAPVRGPRRPAVATARSLGRRAVRPRRETTSQSRGLYLDVPPWHCHVFDVTRT